MAHPLDPRWQRINEIFHEVVDLEPPDREARLTQECSNDDELDAAVRRLLEGDAEGESFLESPLLAVVESAHLEPGAELGDYVIEECIGEGGSSVVYRARSLDETVDRKVAIKILREAFLTDEAVSRFRRECLLLGRLEHPHIARLYHVGGTEGLPFLIMELVDGQDIASYCDEKRLTVRERVELMLPVCEAVQFAHEQLIVHRDLKPSNIVVGSAGVPKLVDFGIAKPLGSTTTSSGALTRSGVPMTPHYASPEQIAGREVTPATDVHALGVLLYELLAGVSPFGDGQEGLLQLARTIADEPRAAMSVQVAALQDDTAVTVAELRSSSRAEHFRGVRGDLDAIVAKALRREPKDRFASVRALAEELERHLNYLPIRSRQISLWARGQRFLRRHPWQVAVAVAGVAVGGGWLLNESDHLREVRAERDRSTAVVDFLATTFSELGPNSQLDDPDSMEALLERSVERVEEVLTDEPATRGTALSALGKVHSRLGLIAKTVSLEREALALKKSVLPLRHREVGQSQMRLAAALDQVGRPKEAIVLYEESLASDFAKEPGQRSALLFGVANALRDDGREEEAMDLLLRAMRLDGWPESTGSPLIGAALFSLADLSSALGKPKDAIRYMEEMVERSIELGEENTSGFIDARGSLAEHKRRAGLISQAETEFRSVIADLRAMKGEGTRQELLFLRSLGDCLLELKRNEEAIETYQQILSSSLNSVPPEHPYIVGSQRSVARALNRLGRADEGLKVIEEALESLRRAHGEDFAYYPVFLFVRGELLFGTGLEDEGLQLMADSMEQLRPREKLGALPSFGEFLLLAEAPERAIEEIGPELDALLEHAPDATEPTEVELALILMQAHEISGRPLLASRLGRRVLERFEPLEIDHEVLLARRSEMREEVQRLQEV